MLSSQRLARRLAGLLSAFLLTADAQFFSAIATHVRTRLSSKEGRRLVRAASLMRSENDAAIRRQAAKSSLQVSGNQNPDDEVRGKPNVQEEKKDTIVMTAPPTSTSAAAGDDDDDDNASTSTPGVPQMEDRDCVYGQWTAWTECTASCGGGRQNRSREVLMHAEGVGAKCDSGRGEDGPCNLDACPEPCAYTDWSDWIGECPSCGLANRTRQRDLISYGQGSTTCEAKVFSITECPDNGPCPVDCEWKDWSPWSTCDAPCGMEQMTSRVRNHSQALYGGFPCVGDAREEQHCEVRECDRDCEWTEWHTTECSASCGGGKLERTRDPRKDTDDPKCKAELFEEECGTVPCPVDCKYGEWHDWGGCSPSCGHDGTRSSRMRFRSVEEEAQHGGHRCSRPEMVERKACQVYPCPVDCQWQMWQPWTNCSTGCGQGWKARARSHTHAEYGGKPCDGNEVEHTECFGTSAPGCTFVVDSLMHGLGNKSDTSRGLTELRHRSLPTEPMRDIFGSFDLAFDSDSQRYELPTQCEHAMELDPSANKCVEREVILEALRKVANISADVEIKLTFELVGSSIDLGRPASFLKMRASMLAGGVGAHLGASLQELEEKVEYTLRVRFAMMHAPAETYERLWTTNVDTFTSWLGELFREHRAGITGVHVTDLKFRTEEAQPAIIVEPAPRSTAPHLPPAPPPPLPILTTEMQTTTTTADFHIRTTESSSAATDSTSTTTNAPNMTATTTATMTSTTHISTTAAPPTTSVKTTSSTESSSMTAKKETLWGDIRQVGARLAFDVESDFGFLPTEKEKTQNTTQKHVGAGQAQNEQHKVVVTVRSGAP